MNYSFQSAKQRLIRQSQSPKPALSKRRAIIFDIDDTAVLSSQAGLPAFRGPQDIPVFNDWAMNARPRANPAVKRLFENMKGKGYETYFVTARAEEVEEGTKGVLSSAGYQGYTGLFHKPEGVKPAEWKAAIRKNLADQGIDISANVGDSGTDFAGGFFRHKVDVEHLKQIHPEALSAMKAEARVAQVSKSADLLATKTIAKQVMKSGEGGAAAASTTISSTTKVARGARKILSQL